MSRFITLSLIVCAITWPAHADLYDQAPPMTSSGYYSNLDSGMRIADEFTLSQPAVITGVTWYGFFFPEIGQDMTSVLFDVSFFTDAADLPGTRISQSIVSATVSDTGLNVAYPVDKSYNGNNIYEFTADLASPVAVAADQTVWLSIVDADSDTTMRWVWSAETLSKATDIAIFNIANNPIWQVAAGDRAFSLTGYIVPVPGAVLLGVLGLGQGAMLLLRRNS